MVMIMDCAVREVGIDSRRVALSRQGLWFIEEGCIGS